MYNHIPFFNFFCHFASLHASSIYMSMHLKKSITRKQKCLCCRVPLPTIRKGVPDVLTYVGVLELVRVAHLYRLGGNVVYIEDVHFVQFVPWKNSRDFSLSRAILPLLYTKCSLPCVGQLM